MFINFFPSLVLGFFRWPITITRQKGFNRRRCKQLDLPTSCFVLTVISYVFSNPAFSHQSSPTEEPVLKSLILNMNVEL